MNELEMLGFLLQDLRDNREADEEDIGPNILRETTRIFPLMVAHGYLSREMFDLTDIDDPRSRYSVPKKYSSYQTTNFPVDFVMFAHNFADWLLGLDRRPRLGIIDIIKMIKKSSSYSIKIKSDTMGVLVTVSSHPNEYDDYLIYEKVLIRTVK